MSLFSEGDQIAAIERTIKDKLRRHGLSSLSVKVRFSHGTNVEIKLSGGSEDDIRRGEAVISDSPAITKSNFITPETIDSDLKITSSTISEQKRKKQK